MANPKRWASVPAKKSALKISNITKLAINNEIDDFIGTYLKPKFIQPPPVDKNWNYIVDIFSKWHGRYLYICSKYACPSSNAISPFFETGFVRLECISEGRYNLAYMRHTGQWWPIEFDLSLEECITTIRTNPLFQQ
jgi:hypothetical protein